MPSNVMSELEYSVITSDVIKSFDCNVFKMINRRPKLRGMILKF